jgi:acyl dehydratase
MIVDRLADVPDLVGQELGTSEWVLVDQARIDEFAASTNDHQWLHTDPARAADGPFGTTVAHGYLTLSLLGAMWTELFQVREVTAQVNYGLNRVRFPSPVPVDSRLRVAATLVGCETITGGVQVTVDAVIEREGGDKPACVVQTLYRLYA